MYNLSKIPTPTQDLSMEQIYDLLMAEIEPELLTCMLPYLDKLYPKEAKQEHELRMHRYAKAMQIFGQRFEALMKVWKEQLREYEARMDVLTKKSAPRKS